MQTTSKVMTTFKEFLGEMTSVIPTFSELETYRQEQEKNLLTAGQLINNVDEFELRKLRITNFELYGLYSEETLASLVVGKFIDIPIFGKVFEVNCMVTKPDWAKKGLTAKIFLFLKSRKKYKIVIGNTVSHANKANLEKLSSKTNFELKWVNVKTGEIELFSSETNEKNFSILGRPTDWQVLIEQTDLGEWMLESKDYSLDHSYKLPWDSFNWTDLTGID